MAKISDEIREFVRRSYEDEHMDPRELLALADRIDAEMVELPRDRDGVPIHVGETVYGEDGRAWHVEGISLGRGAKWVDGHVVHAMGDSGQWRDLMLEWLTHERPDSWERIADELDEMVDAASHADDTCEKLSDLAGRIRKLRELDAIADAMDGGDE